VAAPAHETSQAGDGQRQRQRGEGLGPRRQHQQAERHEEHAEARRGVEDRPRVLLHGGKVKQRPAQVREDSAQSETEHEADVPSSDVRAVEEQHGCPKSGE
jgi:hypothetical protein